MKLGETGKLLKSVSTLLTPGSTMLDMCLFKRFLGGRVTCYVGNHQLCLTHGKEPKDSYVACRRTLDLSRFIQLLQLLRFKGPLLDLSTHVLKTDLIHFVHYDRFDYFWCFPGQHRKQRPEKPNDLPKITQLVRDK